MANSFTAKRSTGNALLPVASASVVEVGDLVIWDEDNTDLRTFSQITDQGSEPLNQQYAAARFAGVARHASASGDTTDVVVAQDPNIEYALTCPSSTWAVGDLVGPSENSGGTALLDQQVEKVVNPAEAIGVCVQEKASATTTVRCKLFARKGGVLSQLGISQEQGVQVLTLSGNLTLEANDPGRLLIDPGGADRTITLEAEATMEGRTVYLLNTANADETMTIQNDGSTAVKYLRWGEFVELTCDGTSWHITREGFNGPKPLATTTATGNITLTDLDVPIQRIDPDGARDLTMPAEGSTNREFLIVNIADMAEVITIKNDGAATLGTPTQNESAFVIPDGTNWEAIVGAAA